MNEELDNELRRIIEAVAFHSSEVFWFAGRASTAWSGAQMSPGYTGGAAPQNPVVQTLQSVLYGYCYSKPFHGTIDDHAGNFGGDDGGWMEALSAANTTRERWEEGWQVQQFLPNGQVQATKRNASRTFWPGEFLTRGSQGMAPQPGTAIAAYFPRESRTMQPGFYFVFGETPSEQQDDYYVVRYYWNVKHEGAAPLVRLLSHALNRYQVPFRFKIVSHPALVGRSDAAILYVSRRYYRVAAALAREVHGELAPRLGEAVPLFSRRLAKGLSFAEDPGTQESFGMSRCRLLAEGLWLAFQEGVSHTGERLERVRRHFADSGASLDRPYLNFAVIDPYEFPQ
jgi:hypothetical protein